MNEDLIGRIVAFVTGVCVMWMQLRHRLRRLRKAERTFEAWSEDFTPID